MKVHQKLAQARRMLQQHNLVKTGENKFSNYKYFELADFIPVVNLIFLEVGLCGIVSYTKEEAKLDIVDIETNETITITSPMSEANLKGAHPIQNLGAVETYLRRYLWITALELVERDVLDKTTAKPDKPTITNARFAKAVDAVKQGKYTTTQLRTDFALTEEQEAVLLEALTND